MKRAFDLSASWSDDGVKGCRRFLDRAWKLQDLITNEEGYSKDLEIRMHQTIKKVSSDFENLKFNTAIAAMMSLINDFYKKGSVPKTEMQTYIILLNPVAPHITEELWQALAPREAGESLMVALMPKAGAVDEAFLQAFEAVKEIVGGVRTIRLQKNIPNKDVLDLQGKDARRQG